VSQARLRHPDESAVCLYALAVCKRVNATYATTLSSLRTTTCRHQTAKGYGQPSWALKLAVAGILCCGTGWVESGRRLKDASVHAYSTHCVSECPSPEQSYQRHSCQNWAVTGTMLAAVAQYRPSAGLFQQVCDVYLQVELHTMAFLWLIALLSCFRGHDLRFYIFISSG